MKECLKRAGVTLAVFVVLYFLLPTLIMYYGYDVNVQAICILASVTGAGFYLVGSK